MKCVDRTLNILRSGGDSLYIYVLYSTTGCLLICCIMLYMNKRLIFLNTSLCRRPSFRLTHNDAKRGSQIWGPGLGSAVRTSKWLNAD